MNFPLRAFAIVLLVSLFAGGPASAKALNGVVNHVTDGDTLWVRPASGPPVQVRIQGLDAPEICQAFGQQARDALAARVLHRTVRVATRARDSYQRSVGNVSLEGQDVGAWLVAGGFAWSARYRGRSGPYAQEEAQARRARLGLWTAGAMEPRAFRRRHGSCRTG
jgi:micrococcal nuclease